MEILTGILTDIQREREARNRAIYERLKLLRSVEGASKTVARKLVAAQFGISPTRAWEIYKCMDARARMGGSEK